MCGSVLVATTDSVHSTFVELKVLMPGLGVGLGFINRVGGVGPGSGLGLRSGSRVRLEALADGFTVTRNVSNGGMGIPTEILRVAAHD